MLARALAVLFVAFAWWLSTALVLKLVWRERATHRTAIGAFTVLALASLVVLFVASGVASPMAALLSFVSALGVWGWHETTFLFGFVTGPRKIPPSPDARGWTRFREATSAVIHHELALAVTMLLLVALTWGRPNQTGTLTFTVLWVMRLSAKLNVFLGVRNLTLQFVPPHLRYLVGYFRVARMNPLMPFSLVLGSVVTGSLVLASLAAQTDFDAISAALLAAILGLAVIEHAFLSAPVPDALLWRWAIRRKSNPHSPLGQPKVETP